MEVQLKGIMERKIIKMPLASLKIARVQQIDPFHKKLYFLARH